jgi:hypothetical protein
VHPDGEVAGNRKGGTRMLVSSFIGSNREFRAWLAMRTRNVVGLGGMPGKKKDRSKAGRKKSDYHYLKYTRWGCLRQGG